MMAIMTVAVYGLGRFGRLWAEMLAEYVEVIGLNRSPVAQPPRNVRIATVDELRNCDAVFLCVAIAAVPEVCRWIAPYLRAGQMVADTCSVKTQPLEWMRAHLPEEVQLLGTHPMFGPDSLSQDSPRGAETSALESEKTLPIVLTQERIDADTYVAWRARFADMGLHVRDMSADAHDREAAYTQGITHLIGRILADFRVPDSEIATLGYRRLQQVMEQTCNDPYQLFLDLQRYNPYTAEMRERFTLSVNDVMESLNGNIDSPYP